MDKATVAVVQAGTVLFDNARTLDKVRAYCDQAAHSGASLVVFPEAFVGGYPKGASFGARVGSRSDAGRDEFRRYFEASITETGPETAALAEIAARHRIHLVIGVVERAGQTLYCSVFFFAPDGSLAGKHRKLMPTASERLIWGMGDGSTMPVIHTDFGVAGSAICWENYMPLFRTAMYAKGVTLWCAPTVDDRETWQPTMRHIAVEGRCFVLSACQYLLRSDCPPDYSPFAEGPVDPVLIRGGSLIVSPFGQVLAGPLRDSEGILTSELDLREIARGKFDLDSVGHYARPDVFSLSVNERANHAVTFAPLEPVKK
jgi:nitrilase